jgi:hypothetical protein
MKTSEISQMRTENNQLTVQVQDMDKLRIEKRKAENKVDELKNDLERRMATERYDL